MNKLTKEQYINNAMSQYKGNEADTAELKKLIGEQYDDMTTFSIKRTDSSEDVLDRKSTKSLEDCKNIAVGIDGKTPYKG